MKTLKRYAILFIIFIANLAPTCSTYAEESNLDIIDFQLRWRHQFQFAGYYAAIEHGYYRKEGFEVRLHEGAPGKTPVEEVLAGRAQYGESNSELLVARMNGQPVVALAAIFQHSPSVLISIKNSGIHSPHDLIGKRVMLLNAETDADLLAMFRNEGIRYSVLRNSQFDALSSYTGQVNIIPSSFDFNDLISGKVDAFNSYLTNEPFLLQTKKIKYNVINPIDYGIDFYSDILFTTEQEIKLHPKRVEAFRRATLEGWRYAMEHPDEIIEILLTKYKIPKSKAHLKFEANSMRSLILPDLVEIGHMNVGRWQRMADAFLTAGMGKQNFSLDDFIYDSNQSKVPKWVSSILLITVVILLLISSVAYYLFRLNRRAAQSEIQLRITNSKLAAEIRAHEFTEASFRESDERFRTLFDLSPDPVWIIDGHRFVECNQSAVTMLGYPDKQSLVDTHPSDLSPKYQPDGEDSFTKAELMMNLAQKRGFHRFEWVHKRKDDSTFFAEVTLSSITLQGRPVIYCVWRDITERKAAAEEVKNLAFYDPLTGLANRRLLMDRLKQALISSSRTKNKGALLYLDLDHFKNLNDTLGHDIGDQLLKQVAERLAHCVREVDTVARLGGDEFVVMLEDLSTLSFEAATEAKWIAQKILKTLSEPYQLGLHEYHNTPSIGATLFNNHDQTVEEILKQADIAMYQSKKAGRNTLYFFDPNMQASINTRALLERGLRDAIDQNQFQLFYQPQIRGHNQIIGAEALIRWFHPDLGEVSPSAFIPIAEEVGMIISIGKWVLETACAQLQAWKGSILTDHLSMSVNVSAIQFRQKDFVDQIRKLVQRYAIDPKLLKLEMTESLLVHEVDQVIINMNALNDLGIQFSLDDFGTGYSSFQYLKQLPLDQLKIERSFIRDVLTDSGDEAIVTAIIAVAKSLNLNVIAEGVETEHQRQLLFAKGCTDYQGYLFSQPISIKKFELLLTRV